MTLRIIQVGMSGWGQSWADEVVLSNKDVELVACVDADPAALTRTRERITLAEDRYFGSFEEALQAVEADAVLITASLPAHIPLTLAALNAGKHVLLEKPFAPSISEARLAVDTAEKQRRILMISQNYRYHPAVQVVTDLIQREVLGSVGTVNLDFRFNGNMAPPQTSRHYKIWHPLLVDMSIHHFDLMRKVLGQEPSRIVCQTWNPSWSNFVEPATGAATIAFERGAVVSYRGSWVTRGAITNWGGEWHMECAEGEIIWTSRGEIPDSVIVRPLGKPEQVIELPKLDAIDRAGSLRAFVQAVETGEEPECSGRNNLQTLAFMLAVVQAADTGEPVLFPAASA